jgi:hypothetical protein
MKTTDKILAQAVRVRACPSLGYGPTAKIKITAQAYFCGGNAHPHFSVTAEIYRPGGPRDCEACGCLHDEAVKFWPAIKPIVALHLSNADDGEPMHGEGNGWYFMAGALGGAGERYHGGNSERQHWKGEGKKEFDGYRFSTPDECLVILAEHLRVSVEECAALRERLVACAQAEADLNFTPDWKLVRAEFGKFVDAQRERWAAEAVAGLALIRSLSRESEPVAA